MATPSASPSVLCAEPPLRRVCPSYGVQSWVCDVCTGGWTRLFYADIPPVPVAPLCLHCLLCIQIPSEYDHRIVHSMQKHALGYRCFNTRGDLGSDIRLPLASVYDLYSRQPRRNAWWPNRSGLRVACLNGRLRSDEDVHLGNRKYFPQIAMDVCVLSRLSCNIVVRDELNGTSPGLAVRAIATTVGPRQFRMRNTNRNQCHSVRRCTRGKVKRQESGQRVVLEFF